MPRAVAAWPVRVPRLASGRARRDLRRGRLPRPPSRASARRRRRTTCARSTSRRSTTASSRAGSRSCAATSAPSATRDALVAGADVARPRRGRAADPGVPRRRSARSTSRARRDVLGAALEAGVRRVVLISSTAVYGVPERHPIHEDDPLVGVGLVRRVEDRGRAARRRVRPARPRVVIVRPKTFVGPERLGVFEILFDWIREGRRIPILGDGDEPLPAARRRGSRRRRRARASTRRSAGEALNVGAGALRHGARRPRGADRPRRLAARGCGRCRSRPAELALRALELARLSPLAEWHYRTAHKDSFVSIDEGARAARLGAAALERRDAVRDLRLVPRAPRRDARRRHDAPRAVGPAGARPAQARAELTAEPSTLPPRCASSLDYRSEFPILEHTTYLINHSLAAMPAAGRGAARRVRARCGASAASARGARAGGRCR